MVDVVILLLGVLLAITAISSFEYYKQIRKAQKEYAKARDLVEDIVLSFNRQLKRESDRFELIAYKVEGSGSKVDISLNKIASLDKRVKPFEEQLSAINQTIQQMLTQEKLNDTNLLSNIIGLESKMKEIESSQETLNLKINDIQGQIHKIQSEPHQITSESVMSVIPIKRDKALAALTDTEITVLEMLSKEGAKTAPEIKVRVQLSREHTARLMKKLYEEGYLEREAEKIPFRYSIKKEMDSLMQKVESNPSLG
jgi:chromosome segregation ATPase